MITIDYKVYTLYDSDGYSHNTIAHFLNESDAKSIAERDPYKGVSPARIKHIIYESLEDYDIGIRGKIKASALAKLTNEEKRILGLDVE